ncbi:hypothetical protein D3C87_2042190 [compost metagenome]
MKLINEQNGLPPERAFLLGLLENLAKIGNAGHHGRQLHKLCLRIVSNNSGNRGFANAGWTPQNEG